MNTPNHEQQLAIDVNGGVLSAGAGSGKTFVIVEHTIQKLKTIARSFQENSHLAWEQKFLIEASKIALLTFTKKAAAEMKERLRSRILQEENNSVVKVELLTDAIDGMFVGTIHSHLLGLLRDGIVPGVENAEIVSQKIFEAKIIQYVEEAIIRIEKSVDPELYSIILTNFDSITNSFIKVFNDVELRLKWEKFSGDNDNEGFWPSFYYLNNIPEKIGMSLDLNEYIEFSDKTWWKAISDFYHVLSRKDEDGFSEHFSRLNDFFSKYKRIVKPKKIDDANIEQNLDFIKTLRSSFKDSKDSIEKYLENEDLLKDFSKVIQKIFSHIDKRVKEKNDITFSNLEYIVHQYRDYSPTLNYLLVDEFQDTSWIQYEIIERLTIGGWKNIFCVGDKKQAIYRFRGGEIGVFDRAIEQANDHLELSNNYRSSNEVVNFNNEFFTRIFGLGFGFLNQGVSQNEMTGQIPQDVITHGHPEVVGIKCIVNSQENKINSSDRERVECDLIIKKVKELSDSGAKEVAVLYSKLAPSYFLIKNLVRENFQLIAQTKLPYADQPVFSIAILLIENALGFYKDKDIPTRNLKEVLGILGIKNEFLFCGERFLKNYNYYGGRFAFLKEFHHMGITISDKNNTINLILEGIECTDGSLENLWFFLQKQKKETYSIEYRRPGKDSFHVHIMTVHSSKGLEFENVILGGIHTNGRSVVNDSLIKKWPGSLKWMPDFNSKKLFKSPQYILESLESKNLDFNEQKRLLYVACTRAKKSLYFPYIYDEVKNNVSSSSKNSWVNAFANCEIDLNLVEVDEVKIEKKNAGRKAPIFHEENFGVIKRDNTGVQFNITVDHSVTGLSDLFFCPRKYYLSNVCKLGESSLKLIDYLHEAHLPGQYSKFLSASKGTIEGSGKDRGNRIHSLIERYIIDKTCVNSFSAVDYNIIENCLELIDKIPVNFELFPEHPIKFEFNGQFVNGVCDLILLDKDRCQAEIWDFKTGAKNKSLEVKYRAQLKLYACGILDLFSHLDSIKLKLIYIDEKTNDEFRFKRSDIPELSEQVSKMMSTPYEKADQNCHQCEYQKVCLVKLTNC